MSKSPVRFMDAGAFSNYRELVRQMPLGGTLCFAPVSWDEYEKLVDDFNEGGALRISYDHGFLEIHSPLLVHAYLQPLINGLVGVLTEALGVEMVGLGSTTFKYQGWQQGLEPDTCFYIQSAARVLGIRRFDLAAPPPPPDLAVELDLTDESLRRFPTYANLGVPEIWRYDETAVVMYHLTDAGYVTASTSRAFPDHRSVTAISETQRNRRAELGAARIPRLGQSAGYFGAVSLKRYTIVAGC